MQQFKKFLWNNGGYIFTNGKPFHHEKILESIALNFQNVGNLLHSAGNQKGFFAFSKRYYC